MRKIIKTALFALIFSLAAAFLCSAASSDVYICNQSGDREYATVGDTLTAYTADIPDGRFVSWYVNNEKYGSVSDTLTVTEELAGASVYAYISYGQSSYTTNTVKIIAAEPSVTLSGSAGDYSAYLTWTAFGNGAEIEGFDISYFLTESPEAELGKISLPSGSSGTTLTGLSGGIEYTVIITAKNSVGVASDSVKITPNDPDLADVTKVRDEIESSSVAIHMNLANTKEAVSSYLLLYFSRYNEYGVTIKDVIITDFTEAKPLSEEDPEAPTGNFIFILELEKGDVRLTTKRIEAEIDNKTSIIYLSADKYSVMTGEKITVLATAFDIEDKAFSWYSSQSETDEGTLMSTTDSPVYEMNADKAGTYYIYCICGGVSSTRIKVTVSEPFIEVADIELSTDTITATEPEILRSTVYPFDAANKNIIWFIENDGGCLCELSGAGRTITAYKPGTVIIKAVIENGLSDGNFEKIFYITVKERPGQQKDPVETETSSVPEVMEIELDCAKIKGIESVTVTAENGTVQITPVTDETVRRILEESDTDATEADLIGAVKFVYEKGAIARSTQMKIKGYDESSVTVISVAGNGIKTVTEQKPVNGRIDGNTVSPDTVILLREKTDKNGNGIFPSVFILMIPVAAAVLIIAYVALKGERNKKKRRAK